ncbi:polysaccharide deacetylase [Paenibacillus donghaensis]|uniref:Polysaccharide deacetylase n=1 Tax=Paenibacillus donghaensis TaxID=414771 RepID=A0A2Z2KPE2_9BACL|nr:polysaccharide deacetylase [Paenibacillus donghaensis]ASA25563.1 polysaccharide deacetylase [Paenibacillus donghaensis]
MKDNKSIHTRKLLSRRGLLVMTVFMLMLAAWGLGQWSGAPSACPQQAEAAGNVSFKNKLPAAVMQELPPQPVTESVYKVSTAAVSAPAQLAVKKQQGKTVYLTFDDGPSRVTPGVLKTLRQEGVKATFFVLGSAASSRPELINAIWEQGHAIGNHSYNHEYKELYSGFTAFWSQIKQTEEVIRNITGTRPSLVRAPGGTFGHFDHTYFRLLEQAGYTVTDWTVDSGDSLHKGVPAADIVRNSTADMKSDKVVLLLHDGGGHEESAKGLPEIIARYKEAGYAFGVLDESVEPVQFRVSAKAEAQGRPAPSTVWVASNIMPNAELFAAGKPLVLEVGKLETKLDPGEYRIIDGHYIVPLRAVVERLGGAVGWNAASHTGLVRWNGRSVTADVRNGELLLSGPDGMHSTSASMEMISGSIWVPLRSLLGATGHPPLKLSTSAAERRVTAL